MRRIRRRLDGDNGPETPIRPYRRAAAFFVLERFFIFAGSICAGVERAKFLQDEMVQDANAKCIEALGEAAGKLDDLNPELDRIVPDLNLRLARRMRVRTSHGYYKIDCGIVGDAASVSFPKTVRRPDH